jgi:hypothetical protein
MGNQVLYRFLKYQRYFIFFSVTAKENVKEIVYERVVRKRRQRVKKNYCYVLLFSSNSLMSFSSSSTRFSNPGKLRLATWLRRAAV